MPVFIISVDLPNPAELAEEMGQRLLGKQIVRSGFPMTNYGSLAILEFPDANEELIAKVQSEVENWISDKHRSLRLRKLTGKRQQQNLGMPTQAKEEVVCLEIRK
jgi:hypothetical protein